jgi:hypothetical protein
MERRLPGVIFDFPYGDIWGTKQEPEFFGCPVSRPEWTGNLIGGRFAADSRRLSARRARLRL